MSESNEHRTLNLQGAQKLAETLTSIPDFPRFQSVIDATAADLLELCQDEERAQWLVTSLRRQWDSWKGTEAMFSFFHANWNPRPDLKPSNHVIDYGAKPAILCAHCLDSGVIKLVDGYHWCTCEQASLMKQEDPGWLDLLNRPIVKPGIALVIPKISGPEIPAVPEVVEPRCERCNGTGYASSDFCDCQMGKDLRITMRGLTS